MENKVYGIIPQKSGVCPIFGVSEGKMIRGVKLILSWGYYDIKWGTEFSVSGKNGRYLEYEKNGVWYVQTDTQWSSCDEAVITMPCDCNIEGFKLKLKDGGVRMCMIDCEKAYFDINNSSAEIESVKADKIGLSLGKGSVVMGAEPRERMDIDCGFGSADIRLIKSCDYSFEIKHGKGSVTLNSEALPREYVHKGGGRLINIVCGMGSVNINT